MGKELKILPVIWDQEVHGYILTVHAIIHIVSHTCWHFTSVKVQVLSGKNHEFCQHDGIFLRVLCIDPRVTVKLIWMSSRKEAHNALLIFIPNLHQITHVKPCYWLQILCQFVAALKTQSETWSLRNFRRLVVMCFVVWYSTWSANSRLLRSIEISSSQIMTALVLM